MRTETRSGLAGRFLLALVFGVLPGAVLFAGLLLLGLVALRRAALRPPVALALARPG